MNTGSQFAQTIILYGYAAFQALAGAITISDKEKLAVVGMNGAGRSTFDGPAEGLYAEMFSLQAHYYAANR